MRGIIFNMYEGAKLSPETSENVELTLTERVVTPYGGIYDYGELPVAVTFDNQDSVYVSEDIAKMLSLALSAQEKVFSGRYPNLEKKLALMNCRKAVFAATDTMSVSEAVDESSDDINALEPLFADVKRMQEAGYGPHLVTESYRHEIKEYLDHYDGSFPCAIHIFECNKNSTRAQEVEKSVQESGQINPDLLQKLHRVHSFMVLGESQNGYVCFQKIGPSITMPFMVDHFDAMTNEYALTEGREGIVFIGPTEN